MFPSFFCFSFLLFAFLLDRSLFSLFLLFLLIFFIPFQSCIPLPLCFYLLSHLRSHPPLVLLLDSLSFQLLSSLLLLSCLSSLFLFSQIFRFLFTFRLFQSILSFCFSDLLPC